MKYLMLITAFNTIVLIISFAIHKSDGKLFNILNEKIKSLEEYIKTIEIKVDNK